MCCFNDLLRLVEKASAGSFDDLANMSDYDMSLVGEMNGKLIPSIIPAILRFVDQLIFIVFKRKYVGNNYSIPFAFFLLLWVTLWD